MNGADLLLLPLLLPLAGAIAAAFLSTRNGARAALVASILTLAAAGVLLHDVWVGGILTYRVGGWAPPFGIVLVADLLGASLATLAALLATASALHTLLAGGVEMQQRFYQPLFLLLLMALGGVFLTGDLFNLYVFMELVILASFPLVAMAERPVSPEATFKYAVLSALGSTLLLVCVALIYAGAGTLNLADLALRMRENGGTPVDAVAAALLLGVFLLKAAIFPFHFWQPDAHSAAPAAVSAMLSGMLVKVGIYGIIRLQLLLYPNAAVLEALAPIGAVAAVFGGLAALANRDLKRLLAYSTISNMGFIVLALGWGGAAGLLAALVNLVSHALIKSALFLSGGYVAERLDEHELRRMGGVAALSPAAAAAFGLGAVALAGLPPTSGFLGKLTLLQAGVSGGETVLLVAVVAASALGLAYTLRAFVLVFWGRTPDRVSRGWAAQPASRVALLAPLMLVVLSLLLGVWPGPLFSLAEATVAELLDPDVYITAVLGGNR
jgi:multicomponent Na+:H+ antiporter subunit D